jgi:predicted site-specific integrase-resolvase
MADIKQAPPAVELDRWLRKKEVLRCLGISGNSLKKLIDSGEIQPIILAPNCHRFSENEINEFMARKMQERQAQSDVISRGTESQDEEMNQLFGCDWGAEIPNYQ